MSNVILTPGQLQLAATTAPYVQPEPYAAKKYKTTYKYLGIIQVVVGILSLIFTIVTHVSGFNHSRFRLEFMSSFWTGILALAAGILGIVSGFRVDPCRLMYITLQVAGAMIVTILAATAAMLMFYTQYVAIVIAYFDTFAIHVILSTLAFTEFVVAIVHLAYCCAVGWFHTNTVNVLPPIQIVVTTTAYPNQMQIAALPLQQNKYEPVYGHGQPPQYAENAAYYRKAIKNKEEHYL